MEKSSYLQLYDHESKNDAYKWQLKVGQQKIEYLDEATEKRPMYFKGDSYHFYEDDTTEFDLVSRFESLEADVSTNAANPLPGQNQSAISALSVSVTSQNAVLQARQWIRRIGTNVSLQRLKAAD